MMSLSNFFFFQASESNFFFFVCAEKLQSYEFEHVRKYEEEGEHIFYVSLSRSFYILLKL